MHYESPRTSGFISHILDQEESRREARQTTLERFRPSYMDPVPEDETFDDLDYYDRPRTHRPIRHLNTSSVRRKPKPAREVYHGLLA